MEEATGMNKEHMCSLCLQQKSRYTCPRCNVAYCSVACYKGEAHMACSEAFYRDCFMEGLTEKQVTREERFKVLEMLSRLEDEHPAEVDSDDDAEDLALRISGLDLDNEKDLDTVWQRLTETERKEFQTMLQNGRIGHLVEIWEPWWIFSKDMVEEVGKESALLSRCPPLKKDIPALSHLLKSSRPNDCVSFNIVNILYGYAYMKRLNNGVLDEKDVDVCRNLVSLSDALLDRSYSSSSEAIHGCMHALNNQAKTLQNSLEYATAIVQDVIRIISGPSKLKADNFTMSALSELHKIFRRAKKLIGSGDTETKLNYFKVQKKLEFLLSWVLQHGELLQALLPELELELCELTNQLQSHLKVQKGFEDVWGGKKPPQKLNKFIEEL